MKPLSAVALLLLGLTIAAGYAAAADDAVKTGDVATSALNSKGVIARRLLTDECPNEFRVACALHFKTHGLDLQAVPKYCKPCLPEHTKKLVEEEEKEEAEEEEEEETKEDEEDKKHVKKHYYDHHHHDHHYVPVYFVPVPYKHGHYDSHHNKHEHKDDKEEEEKEEEEEEECDEKWTCLLHYKTFGRKDLPDNCEPCLG